MLFHEKGTMPWEFMALDNWNLINSIGRPSSAKPSDPYWPVVRDDPEDPVVGEVTGPKSLFFHPARMKWFKTMNYTKEEIEAAYQDYKKTLNIPGLK